MTARIAEISEISSDSHVLDLGCGRGRPILDIAVDLGCSVVGVDLSEGNIDMANESLERYRREKKPDIDAKFYAASYFYLPEEVLTETFTHVMMQTSLFYSHHRVDEIFGPVSRILCPGGRFVATDFCRISDVADVQEFMKWNSMPAILSLEEIKAALSRNGLEYCGGENLDRHCIRCHAHLREKIVRLGIPEFSPPDFHRSREDFIKNSQVTFHLIMAQTPIYIY